MDGARDELLGKTKTLRVSMSHLVLRPRLRGIREVQDGSGDNPLLECDRA